MGHGKKHGKLYITAQEHINHFGGKKEAKQLKNFKALPFFCCSLSLTEFQDPYMDQDGHIFDILNIVPWLKKHGTCPVDGTPLDAKQLTKLHFTKNADGKYHCPVTFKVFNSSTHIVAIKTSGYVYAYEAVRELNIKAKNWLDLITSEKFKKTDIVSIQDPQATEKRDYSNFQHVALGGGGSGMGREGIRHNDATRRVLGQLEKTMAAAKPTSSILTSQQPAGVRAAQGGSGGSKVMRSQGLMSGSLTSTGLTPRTIQTQAVNKGPVNPTTKGYVQLVTNMGHINIELHCDIVPRTCENFITHAARGYYNGTKFHRNIKHFMIQGGDPTASGKGGESIWGGNFADEFRNNRQYRLKHDVRGVVAMANSGPDTNGSQFYITYKSASHLDDKHTVFGKVVGGLDTLAALEKVPVDAKKEFRPLHDIVITETKVFQNPYTEDAQAAEAAAAKKKQEEEAAAHSMDIDADEYRGGWYSAPQAATGTAQSQGVGKYLNRQQQQQQQQQQSRPPKRTVDTAGLDTDSPVEKKARSAPTKTQFKDFSSW